MSRKSIPWLLTAFLLALLAVHTHAWAQTAPLQGTFTYVPDQSDNVDQAVETAVSKLNFFVRSPARKRLREMNAPYQRIVIELTATQVSITGDRSAPMRTAPDGTPGAWADAVVGAFQVSTRWEGSVLKQEFSAKHGQRINAYAVSPDAQTLTLQVMVSSQRLKEPVMYRLVYRRVSAEANSDGWSATSGALGIRSASFRAGVKDMLARLGRPTTDAQHGSGHGRSESGAAGAPNPIVPNGILSL